MFVYTDKKSSIDETRCTYYSCTLALEIQDQSWSMPYHLSVSNF